MKKRLALARVYRLLEPGPVVLLTTEGRKVPNIMTMSWHTMLDFEPPLIGCVVSNRNYSFGLLRDRKECVINIPASGLARAVVACGNSSGRKLDKFKAFGLTAKPAACVGAPLVDECYANIECELVDTRLVKKYNLFVLQGLRAWIDPSVRVPRTLHHLGMGRFMVAGKTLQLRSAMK